MTARIARASRIINSGRPTVIVTCRLKSPRYRLSSLIDALNAASISSVRPDGETARSSSPRNAASAVEAYRPARRSCRATARSLFDHLIGAQHDRWGYGKAKRLGGLAVHDHLVFGRQLNRKITRLLAAQNAINISGGTTKGIFPVVSV